MDIAACIKAYFESQPSIKAVQLFGSAATGRLRPDSDIDLAVLAEEKLGAEEKLRLIRELGQLTGRPIDLIDLHSASGPILKQSLSSGKCLIRRDPDALAQILLRMLAYETDFAPIVHRMERATLSSWLKH